MPMSREFIIYTNTTYSLSQRRQQMYEGKGITPNHYGLYDYTQQYHDVMRQKLTLCGYNVEPRANPSYLAKLDHMSIKPKVEQTEEYSNTSVKSQQPCISQIFQQAPVPVEPVPPVLPVAPLLPNCQVETIKDRASTIKQNIPDLSNREAFNLARNGLQNWNDINPNFERSIGLDATADVIDTYNTSTAFHDYNRRRNTAQTNFSHFNQADTTIGQDVIAASIFSNAETLKQQHPPHTLSTDSANYSLPFHNNTQLSDRSDKVSMYLNSIEYLHSIERVEDVKKGIHTGLYVPESNRTDYDDVMDPDTFYLHEFDREEGVHENDQYYFNGKTIHAISRVEQSREEEGKSEHLNTNQTNQFHVSIDAKYEGIKSEQYIMDHYGSTLMRRTKIGRNGIHLLNRGVCFESPESGQILFFVGKRDIASDGSILIANNFNNTWEKLDFCAINDIHITDIKTLKNGASILMSMNGHMIAMLTEDVLTKLDFAGRVRIAETLQRKQRNFLYSNKLVQNHAVDSGDPLVDSFSGKNVIVESGNQGSNKNKYCIRIQGESRVQHVDYDELITYRFKPSQNHSIKLSFDVSILKQYPIHTHTQKPNPYTYKHTQAQPYTQTQTNTFILNKNNT